MKDKKKHLPALLVLVVSLVAARVAAGPSVLRVSDAYIPETPPGLQVAAGYFSVTNQGDEDCSLLGAAADGIPRIEIHANQHHQGMMHMRPVDTLVVAAGQTLSLAPGAFHLMLLDLKEPLRAGAGIEIQLNFGDCGVLEIPFSVKGLHEG